MPNQNYSLTQEAMTILIVGGAGYIGSHANKLLSENGYDTVVLDNLVTGHREFARWGEFVEGDLGDRAVLDRIFTSHKIDAVMHFAAFACVGESVAKPSIYYDNNVARTLVLLDAMMTHGVNNFVFSSTCATFGEAKTSLPKMVEVSRTETLAAHRGRGATEGEAYKMTRYGSPMDETLPQNPVSPYGWSKLMVERILRDYDVAYGFKHCIFRYFNAAGADDSGVIGERHVPETHLIPLVLDVAAGKRPSISVFGNDYPTPDGTCIRDYIHVTDLADAHLKGLQQMLETNASDDYNLGCGCGHSVQEVLESARKITKHAIPTTIVARRDGDPPVLIGSSEKARRLLGWEPCSTLDDCIRSAWRWHKKMG
ncbi:MAG: NAD-dependent epimerase/dehydratase family protein [Thermoguttaceae bacterium]